MRYLLPMVLLLTSCFDDVLTVIPNCGKECAIASDGRMLLDGEAYQATCNTGIVVCKDSEEFCVGFTPYSAEICDADNIDEDCNGESNNIDYGPADYRNTCDGVGACASARMECQSDGSWSCRPASAIYGAEVCDLVDNDCDGLTDAEDPDMQDGDFIYSGPPDTLNVGECRAGISRCVDGRTVPFGQILPREEICGNGDDDDCDGFTDEDDNDTKPASILLVIDFSGSMANYIRDVAQTICDISQNSILRQSTFAIQAVASNNTDSPFVETVNTFANAQETCDVLNAFVANNVLIGGFEYVPEAIFGTNEDTEFYLPWPSNTNRQVIFFTDEEPQASTSDYRSAIDLVIDSCAEHDYKVGGFAHFHDLWQPMTDGCNGWLENLSTNSESMTETLRQRFVDRCDE